MSEWPLAAIDDLVEDIIDRRGVTPFKLDSNFTTSGHRVISAKLVKGGTIDLAADEPRYVDRQTYSRWMRSPLRADDVILTSEAPLGEAAYLRSDVDWALGQRLFALRTDKRRLHGRYLYYALQSDPSRSDLLARATGTTAQGVRQTELRRVQIPLPPLPEQRRIAHILGALDDKIELNRRMNEALEAIAHALFKSWFLDDAAPDERPLVSLGSLVELVRDQLIPPDFPDETFAHFSIPAFDAGQVPTLEPGSTIRSAKFVVPSDAILLSKLNPEIPRIWLPDVRPEHRSICSTEFMVLRPRHPSDKALVYCLLQSEIFRRQIESLVTGTSRSHQRAQPSTVLALHVPGPASELRDKFSIVAGPTLDRIRAARAESQTLSSLRDALLPKLISGELRIERVSAIGAALS